ncbi:MAG TPA: RIP metalloprotease RseP [Candidatus Krumholzibacteria bacterium]|nr:RIP metalloprotease RseP [Candidatus Krumholzibacteria bacterium]
MLTTILAGLFVLGVVIIVHEFGHFIVAKLAGVYVKVFSVGFGKRILRWRRGETVYAISALPFGGYVKFAGESDLTEVPAPDPETPPGPLDETPDSEIPRERYFTTQRKLIRAAILLAGPFMNYLLAVVLFVGMYFAQGVSVVPTTRVGQVTADGPAALSGIAPGDTIASIDGARVEDWYDIESLLTDDPSERKAILVRRDGHEREITFEPKVEGRHVSLGMFAFTSSRVGRVQKNGPAYRAGLENGAVIEAINDTLVTEYADLVRIINANADNPLYVRWTMDGLAHADTIVPEPKQVLKAGSTSELTTVGIIGIHPYAERRREGLFTSIGNGFYAANETTAQIVGYLGLLFTGRMGVTTLGGPITITQMAGDVANWGFDYLLGFLAFFNINLCVFNLIPLLPFDGGHLAILAIEGVMRRPVNRRLRDWLTQGGFVLIILLMAFVLVLDLSRCAGSTPSGF